MALASRIVLSFALMRLVSRWTHPLLVLCIGLIRSRRVTLRTSGLARCKGLDTYMGRLSCRVHFVLLGRSLVLVVWVEVSSVLVRWVKHLLVPVVPL